MAVKSKGEVVREVLELQRAAMMAGMVVPPLQLTDVAGIVLDPIVYPFELAAGVHAADDDLVDLLAAEQTPWAAATENGVLKSAGTTEPYGAFVYGMAVALEDNGVMDDIAQAARYMEIGFGSLGVLRSIPFVEMFRVVPGVMRAIDDAAAPTDARSATGCPNGGKPQYQFPAWSFIWGGDKAAELGYRYMSAVNFSAAVKGALVVWLIAAPVSDGRKLRDGTGLGESCYDDAELSTPEGVRATLATLAGQRRFVKNGL